MWQRPSRTVVDSMAGCLREETCTFYRPQRKAGYFKPQGKQFKKFFFVITTWQNESSPCLFVTQELVQNVCLLREKVGFVCFYGGQSEPPSHYPKTQMCIQ